jgi:hypothetical protein
MCPVYLSEFIVSEKNMDPTILVALTTHYTPNLTSCNGISCISLESSAISVFSFDCLCGRLSNTIRHVQNTLALDPYTLLQWTSYKTVPSPRDLPPRVSAHLNLCSFKGHNFVAVWTDDFDELVSCGNRFKNFLCAIHVCVPYMCLRCSAVPYHTLGCTLCALHVCVPRAGLCPWDNRGKANSSRPRT